METEHLVKKLGLGFVLSHCISFISKQMLRNSNTVKHGKAFSLETLVLIFRDMSSTMAEQLGLRSI